MKIVVKKRVPGLHKSEALVHLLFHNEAPGDFFGLPDEQTRKRMTAAIKNGDIRGGLYEVHVIYSDGPIRRILLVGGGKRSEFNTDKLRGAYAKVARKLRELNVGAFSTIMPPQKALSTELQIMAEAMVEGAILGLYRFLPYKTDRKESTEDPQMMTIIAENEVDVKAIKQTAEKARIVCEAVGYVRDLVSTPANDMTPTILAGKALRMNGRHRMRVKVLDRPAMAKLRMNAILGVAQGSHEPPKFIVMEYSGANLQEKPIVLIGKGITFDSGGISLKPAEKMGEMKSDMAGAAVVLGILQAVSQLKLPILLVGLLPIAENLPSGSAYRPGDVLTSMSKKTVEIVSTDAEGRLLLADALTYAQRFDPKAIIDIATLTGACGIVFADLAVGMLGNDSALKQRLLESGYATGERVWELPLWEEYGEMIKSDVADLKNTGGREGGVITAAFFLSKFVGSYPWVHLDIASTAWIRKDRPYIPKGASGIGVRLLVDVLIKEAASAAVKKSKNG